MLSRAAIFSVLLAACLSLSGCASTRPAHRADDRACELSPAERAERAASLARLELSLTGLQPHPDLTTWLLLRVQRRCPDKPGE